MTMQMAMSANTLALTEPSGWPAQGHWRYEDYQRLPDDGKRYEIIEGVLYVANAPSLEHQFAAFKVAFHLELFVGARSLGLVLPAPFEVHLSGISRPVQPDVLFISAAHLPPPGAKMFDGAPDLIVEVVSPSSIRLDRTVKFDAYEQAGVTEYWIVDTKTRSVEVHTLARGEYALHGQYTGDELITSALLPELQIKTSLLFQPQSN